MAGADEDNGTHTLTHTRTIDVVFATGVVDYTNQRQS